MAGFREGIREWWSRLSASWVGMRSGFEENEPRIRALDAHAGRLQLDPVRVRQLVRPRFHVLTMGYSPAIHLFPNRLKRALSNRVDLPHELHVLAVADDSSRKALLDATQAYASHIAPRFHYEALSEDEPEKSRERAQMDFVLACERATYGRLSEYLRLRKVKSPLLSAWLDANSESKRRAREKNAEPSAPLVGSAPLDGLPDSLEPDSLQAAGPQDQEPSRVVPPRSLRGRDYPAPKQSSSRRQRPKRGR